MNMPLKAPIPAATGRGAGYNVNNGNKSISKNINIYNHTEDSVKKINAMSDIMPILERRIEQALVTCLVLFPKATIDTILSTRIEPTFDQEVLAFWQTIRPKFQEILNMGEPEITEYIYSLMGYPFFARCNRAYEDLGRPVEPKIVTNDLIAVRTQRKSIIYIQENKLIERFIDGWTTL